MKDKFDSVRFNLTDEMLDILIKFNKLKKSSNKNIEKELNEYRKQFIKAFKENNKEEIIKYLEIKNQK